MGWSAKGRSRSQQPKHSAWMGFGKYPRLRERSQPRDMPSFCPILSEKSSDDDIADYVGMRLRYWLRMDRRLPEKFRSAKNLREAIAVKVW